MKKTRADAVIDRLPRNQREALDRWLFEENLSYDQALERLHLDFGVRVGRSALSAYWQRCKQRELLATIASSSMGADEVSKTFAANTSKFYEPMMKLIERLAFEKMLNGEKVDVSSVVDLTNLLQQHFGGLLKLRAEERKERELALKKEKLELELRKYEAQFEKAKGTLDSKLTPEEKQQRLRQIFGMT